MITNFERRKYRVRNSIAENNKSGRPRVVIFRSNKNTYAQLVDSNGFVLKSFSTLNLKDGVKMSGLEKAKLVGKEFAKNCLEINMREVVFDKGAYKYSGRVKAVAEACREFGLQF